MIEVQPKDDALPPLRQDILLSPAPRRRDGTPGWVVVDPAANAHYSIGWREFEMLSRWHLGDPAAVLASTGRETSLRPGERDLAELRQFLEAHGLVRVSAAKLIERQAKMRAKSVWQRISRALGTLLFKNIPMAAPERFLDSTLFLARPFFTVPFCVLMALILLLALYLTGRLWPEFVAGFDHFFSLEGILSVAVALGIAKSVHELAHAYAARLAGVEVPSMGVSLILLWPVLYTETSGAWRVPHRGKRFRIAAAGVAAEISLAILALAVWPFLDPGPLRNMMQFAATSLVVLSLAINANPLMRFDGYFMLCDLTGVDNLQARSFAMLAWASRWVMAGGAGRAPEPGWAFGARTIATLYGVALGLYRVVLYAGIAYGLALVVFPSLGLMLAGAVVVFYLVQPLAMETARWFVVATKRLGQVFGPLRVGLALSVLALPLVVPWRTTLSVPALVRIGEAQDIYAPEPGRVLTVRVADGAEVGKGEVLVELASREMTHRFEAGRLKAARLERVLSLRRTGEDYLEADRVAFEELAQIRVELAGLEARRQRLVLRAPVAGRVSGLDPGLRTGLNVRQDQRLLQVLAEGAPKVEAFIDERDLAAVAKGAAGRLWFEGEPLVSAPIAVEAVFEQAVPRIEAPVLASVSGGPIAVRPTPDKEWMPETGLYRAALTIGDLPPSLRGRQIETRGYAIIETPPRNLLSRIIDRIIGVWRREIG